MSDRTAQVTLGIDEWDDMRNKQQRLHDEIAALGQQLAAAERQDPTGRLVPVLETIEAAIPVIQFAVGNLHPDTIIGWPYESLRSFADLLNKMPGATHEQKELTIELRAFAGVAEMRARERAMRPIVPVVSVPAEPEDDTADADASGE
jgi:hypothetical protein